MSKYYLGQIRRSQVLSYGPGAIVDFRSPLGRGTASFIAGGLEFWNESKEPEFPHTGQKISERRLEKKYGVRGFRLPPVDNRDTGEIFPKTAWLKGIRFPSWLHCPKCERLKWASQWTTDNPGDMFPYCSNCSSGKNRGKKTHVVPARFILACEKGHVDDFPWEWWLDRFDSTNNKRCEGKCRLYLKGSGSTGLSGLYISCGKCERRASLSGIFGPKTFSNRVCSGKTIWLGRDQLEECGNQNLRALQRGASNLYFPMTDSAISIPPWSDTIQDLLGADWHDLAKATPEDMRAFLRVRYKGKLEALLEKSLDEIVDDLVKQFSEVDEGKDLKLEEYESLRRSEQKASPDFEVRPLKKIPDELIPYFSKVSKVVRLREVRVLHGFTRIHEPGGGGQRAPISRVRQDWLPGVEIRGEGIYLELNHEMCAEWEKNEKVKERAERVDKIYRKECIQKGVSEDEIERITPRLLLIHTFAHILIRQLALSCGYNDASLRERLYVSDGKDGMRGLLIYTGTSDSDGTLGGLSRQADPDLLVGIINEAVNAVSWCSSDPLCLSGDINASQPMNIAACHACVLAPETSCERYNKFLDRVMVIGDPEQEIPGFFESMLK